MATSQKLPTAEFDGSHPFGRFLVSTGLPSKAWEASTAAYKSEKPFVLHEIDHVVFFAFTGSDAIDEFLSESTEFGEENINVGNHLFTSLKDNNGEPAVVNRGLLRGFLNLIHNSDFQDKVEWSRRQAEGIVFTGHCLGGAMAALATLWMLLMLSADKSRRKTQKLPFCVTFGCPLLGDQRLAQAVGREKWSGQFCHVVSKHDVLPRVLLVPYPSIQLPLKALLPYFYSIMQSCNDNQHPVVPFSNDQTYSFLVNVMNHSKTVATTCSETKRQSPYRPFGYYLFCSEKGAACVENGLAVLQMLYFTLQDMDPFSQTFLREHIDYGKLLDHNLRNLNNKGGLATAHSEAENPYELGIAMALEAAGVEIQNAVSARDTLVDIGRIGIRPSLNSAEVHAQSARIQGARVEIEWYKTSCERDGVGYYDSFKNLNTTKDFRANMDRLKISRFWDDFIRMVETNDLPEDFHLRPKWVYAGTYYRHLVEPLDIAFYYRSGKHRKFGHYLHGGRHHRYKILEKWLQESNLNRERICRTKLAGLTQDSCFWARLEEAKDWLDAIKEERDPAMNTELMNKMEGFVNHVHELVKARDISRDVLLEEGSFIKWWKEYRRIPTYETQLVLIESQMRSCLQ